MKPNIVVIYCDDLGYGDLGCFGSKEIRTPHIDALSEDGTRFTDWYSNCPVCSPSRAALLTGCYPEKTGVTRILGSARGTPGLTSEHVTLATMLKSAGYQTALIGKWHLGTMMEHSPNSHGFDYYFGHRGGCLDYFSHIMYYVPNPVHDLWENDKETWENGKYLTELFADKAVEYIEHHTEDPFFLYLAFNAPHYPMHAPAKYLDRFKELPPERRIMAAMISALDDGVGNVVETLKRNGLYENTLIFFSSDNGPSDEIRNFLDGSMDLRYYGGSAFPFRGHKGSLFEGGIRVPAIMSFPNKIPSGETIKEPLMMMDFVPTALEMCGLTDIHIQNAKIDGKDLTSVIREGSPSPHEALYWTYRENQTAVREGPWKLVVNGEDLSNKAEPIHLSNLDDDPRESVNLCQQYPERVHKLLERIQKWSGQWQLK